MTAKTGLVIGGILVVAAFLGGFIPEYLDNRQLHDQLEAIRQQTASTQERSAADSAALQIGYVYLQTNLKNYGVASQYATKFFDRVRGIGGQTTDPNWRSAIPTILSKRDEVIGGLAKGEASTVGAVQDIFQQTLQATQSEWK
jgi:hypothetical protein